MVNLVYIGEQAGSGISNIFSIWNKQGWPPPTISESFEPERIMLSLIIEKSGNKKTAIKTIAHKQAIIEYLTENVSAKGSELATLVGVKSSRIQVILSEMIADGIVESNSGNRNKTYRLKGG